MMTLSATSCASRSHVTSGRPIARAASLSSPARDVFLKIETELPTGSFKVRGAIYALSLKLAGRDGLQAVPRVSEVVCASTGNHGAAVAYAAQQLGIRATIFLPARPNLVKAARILDLGARLVDAGADLSDAIDAAEAYAAREGAFFLHDARDPNVPVGAGTIGLEIVDRLPAVDVIYVPMGDAGADPGRRLGRQAPALLHPHRRRRRRARAGVSSVVAEKPEHGGNDCRRDGDVRHHRGRPGSPRPLIANVNLIRELVHDVVPVSEQKMMGAIAHLHAQEQVIAEPAGAAAAAAVLKQSTAAGTIVALVTGGNIAHDLRLKLIGGNDSGASTTPPDVA